MRTHFKSSSRSGCPRLPNKSFSVTGGLDSDAPDADVVVLKAYLDKENPYIRVIILSAVCPTRGSKLVTEGISMIRKLIATDNDIATTILRLVLGVIFFAHGAQKMLGWFGGYGLSGSMEFFTRDLGIPAPFAFLAICAEFFGGLMLIVGFLGRLAALTIICTMAVAVVKVHWQFGVFMNWFGTQKGEGFE